MDYDLAAQTAGSAHGPWRISNSPALAIALPNDDFLRTLRLASLAGASRIIDRTAVYGPVRTVVWEGRSREASLAIDRVGRFGMPQRRFGGRRMSARR